MSKFFDFLKYLFKRKETIIIIPVEKKPSTPEPTGTNEWKVLKFVAPDNADGLIRVMYSNEIGLRTTVHCMAVFESSSQFKLIAPWLGAGKLLIKGNITDFQTSDASKSSVKDYEKE